MNTTSKSGTDWTTLDYDWSPPLSYSTWLLKCPIEGLTEDMIDTLLKEKYPELFI